MRAVVNCQGLAALGPEARLPQGHPFGQSVPHATKCCVKNLHAESRRPETLQNWRQGYQDVCSSGAAEMTADWTDRHEQDAQRSRLAAATPATPLAR